MGTKSKPDWYSLSHRDRCERLTRVRREWCERLSGESNDRRDRTVYLEGAWINDVPSFYLSLGEAINGPGGYFGGSLDALADCLCDSFGVRPPLTVLLSHFDEVRDALDGRAWCRFRAEGYQKSLAEDGDREFLVDAGYLGDGGVSDIAPGTARYTAALAREPFDCDGVGSYFDALLEVFQQGRAELVPESYAPSQFIHD